MPDEYKTLEILIVDDDKDMRENMADVVSEFSHITYLAASGTEALQKVAESSPDLIILDIQMPALNGWEVLQNLRSCEKLKSLPVIICSGSSNARKQCKTNGDSHTLFLEKPFNPDVLKNILGKVIQGRGARV